jgi:Ulp1 family protease
MYITHPHLWHIVKNRIKEKGKSKDSVIKFVRKKFSVPIEVKVGLIPFQDANHWSVIIMSDDSLYHYDPSKSANIFHLPILHHFFDKIWAMTQGKLPRTNEWKQAMSKMSWTYLDGPQQVSNWECGFYVIKFMTKFYKWMTHDRSTCLQVFF